MTLRQRLQQRLAAQRAADLWRTPPLVTSPTGTHIQLNGRQVINFAANDYLGLTEDPDIRAAVCADDQAGFGSGAAHLVSGHHLHHHLLEDELADWLGVERVLLFSTGYMANLAVQQALAQRGDTLIHDKLNHASLLDGARLSEAVLKRYPHVDMKALARRLAAAEGQAIIVTDGVFSMDGDLAPLPEIMRLKAAHSAWLVVDEAHAFGVVGQSGRGTFEHFGLTADENVVRVGTLGKAFGVFGAFVAGTTEVIEALVNFARPWIYTTALPPANALAARVALKKVRTADEARAHLRRLIDRFRREAAGLGLTLMASATPIQPVLLGEAARALAWSRRLFERGLHVPAIRPPTVPQGQARLRITFSARHTEADLDHLLEALEACCRAEP
ncbi:8-amino-7-oxononanoate synthase [Sulfurivirga sp.]|uniref:8-amino-7-oxononanoate synthase n=1 Tax=Sulfurivirga sp. TaxID=2614236 RepID=UPI00345C10D5